MGSMFINGFEFICPYIMIYGFDDDECILWFDFAKFGDYTAFDKLRWREIREANYLRRWTPGRRADLRYRNVIHRLRICLSD